MNQPSILDTIKALNDAEAVDNHFIIAMAINMYSEALRRVSGRLLFNPSDVPRLFNICETLLTRHETDLPIKSNGRSKQMTKEEEDALLKAIEHPGAPLQ